MSPPEAQARILPWVPASPREGQSERELVGRSRARMWKFGQFYKGGYASSYQAFMFSGCAKQRNGLLSALVESAVPVERQERIRNCGGQTFLYRNVETGEVRTRTWMCGERWCPVCGPSLVRRMKWQMLENIPVAERGLSFVTLTQPQIPGEGLRYSMDRLIRAFRYVRNSRVWREKVLGGLYVLEITPSKTYAKTYHTHLHLIVDAYWINQVLLSRVWERASGGLGVHIREVDNRGQCGSYLSKYLSKPVPKELFRDHDGLVAALDALRNRRLVMTFGSWRGAGLTETARTKRRIVSHSYGGEEWTFLGSLEFHLENAERGSQDSQKVLCEAGFGPFPLDLVTLFAPFEQRAPPRVEEKTLWTQTSTEEASCVNKRKSTGGQSRESSRSCGPVRTRQVNTMQRALGCV